MDDDPALEQGSTNDATPSEPGLESVCAYWNQNMRLDMPL